MTHPITCRTPRVRRLPHLLRARAAVGVAAVLLLGACGSAVEVAPPAAADDPACAAITWPGQVAQRPRTSTSPDSPATAAWASRGAPAIVARCGVPVPGPTRDECLGVDGVDWVARRLEDGMSFTTYGRTPAIEVLVPSAYAPEPLVLSSFASAAQTGRPTGHRCR
ncbi:DUF3515 family protein [Mobilicoccus pelagius]|uniref:DUF3515 family protein n=1 Tax=Mobilicoccus pelagius NBRC 104925 TaxID=1089455 RepID=H5UNF7_9MICO|nr:DUF3515 family protein [Mobilicoccus pelagius]GAB47265.1 hypothetical protein MOPEL_007_00810 [Mobilicoccus pelagius NBRC 104925]